MGDKSFAEMLLADVAGAIRRHERSGTQAHNRDLVRTAFAALEGFAWIFREHVIEAARSTFGLEAGEEAAFSEQGFHVSETGKIHTQTRFVPLVNSIRLTARVSERLAPTKRIDFSGSEWNGVRAAVDIRNRITHPKGAQDLVLTDGDVAVCTEALFWFLAQITDAMDATNVAVKDYLGELHSVLEKLKTGDPDMIALYESVENARSQES